MSIGPHIFLTGQRWREGILFADYVVTLPESLLAWGLYDPHGTGVSIPTHEFPLYPDAFDAWWVELRTRPDREFAAALVEAEAAARGRGAIIDKEYSWWQAWMVNPQWFLDGVNLSAFVPRIRPGYSTLLDVARVGLIDRQQEFRNEYVNAVRPSWVPLEALLTSGLHTAARVGTLLVRVTGRSPAGVEVIGEAFRDGVVFQQIRLNVDRQAHWPVDNPSAPRPWLYREAYDSVEKDELVTRAPIEGYITARRLDPATFDYELSFGPGPGGAADDWTTLESADGPIRWAYVERRLRVFQGTAMLVDQTDYPEQPAEPSIWAWTAPREGDYTVEIRVQYRPMDDDAVPPEFMDRWGLRETLIQQLTVDPAVTPPLDGGGFIIVPPPDVDPVPILPQPQPVPPPPPPLVVPPLGPVVLNSVVETDTGKGLDLSSDPVPVPVPVDQVPKLIFEGVLTDPANWRDITDVVDVTAAQINYEIRGNGITAQGQATLSPPQDISWNFLWALPRVIKDAVYEVRLLGTLAGSRKDDRTPVNLQSAWGPWIPFAALVPLPPPDEQPIDDVEIDPETGQPFTTSGRGKGEAVGAGKPGGFPWWLVAALTGATLYLRGEGE